MLSILFIFKFSVEINRYSDSIFLMKDTFLRKFFEISSFSCHLAAKNLNVAPLIMYILVLYSTTEFSINWIGKQLVFDLKIIFKMKTTIKIFVQSG